MKKCFLIATFLLFFSVGAMASLFPPSCVCTIKARILSIQEKPVKKDEFRQKDLTALDLEIKVLQVIGMVKQGISPEQTCDKSYKVGEKIKLQAIKEKDFVDKNPVLAKGTIIRGNIEYSGDERGPWYNFNNIQIVKP